MMPRLHQHSAVSGASIKRTVIVGVDIKGLRKTPAAREGQSAVQNVAKGGNEMMWKKEEGDSDTRSIAVSQRN